MKTTTKAVSTSFRIDTIPLKLFIIIAIILINYTLLTGELEIGEYGAIYSYGIAGLFSITLILLAIFIGLQNRKTYKYAYIGICYLVLIFFIPQIFAKLPIFPFVYRIYGHIDYIIHTGHINPENLGLGYQTWPGAMFLGAVLEIVTKLGVYILLTLPVLRYLIIVPLIYLLIRGLTNNTSHAILGTMFFIISFYGFNWFAPGGLAFLIEMIGIYILFRICYLKKNENFLKFGVILMLLTGILVFTHFLTSIFWMVTIIDFLILSMFIIKNKRFQEISVLLLLLFVIFQFYWLFGHMYSINLFKQRLNDLICLLKATESVEKWTAVAQSGVTPHAKVLGLKMYFMYSIIGISLVGMLIVLAESLKRFFKTGKVDILVILLLLLFVSYSLAVPAIVGAYSGEIAARLFGVIRYILVIFVTLALKNAKFRRALIVTLFVFSYLSILCTYGNMTYDYVEPNEVTGIFYTSANIQSKFYTIPDALWDIKYLTKKWQYILPIGSLNLENAKDNIIILSSRRIEGNKFFTGKDLNIIDIKIKSSKIYCSDNYYMNVPSKFEIYYGG
ncbi:hypothetical protein E3E31_00145 [Thermococcus sp. M39]|uniref:hypothetical protein n=1 Tax=Thermococcus sp. M39 TaxID=1638262 RepID=UPI00143A4590|nr:hypothetical protein [Thermococcus sp. M39]NJE06967.1 hypothetical protein [Thermococcus sp. M39]